MKTNKNCIICGCVFQTLNSNTNHKMCTKCKTKKCFTCSKKIIVKLQKKLNRKNFCSTSCYYKSQKGLKQSVESVRKRAESNTGRKTGHYINCSFCKKEKYVETNVFKKRKYLFCNPKCFKNWSKSPLNPSFLGEKIKENKRIRSSFALKKWARKVKERDKYTCVMCKGKPKNTKHVHADHIKPFCLFPKLRFDINNGRTLCIDCHKKTETWGLNQYYFKNAKAKKQN